MINTNREKKQKPALQHFSLVTFVLPALLAALFVVLCTVADTSGYILSQASVPSEFRYSAGDSEDTEDIPKALMTKVGSLSDIDTKSEFVYVVFSVPASEKSQSLVIRTDFAQVRVTVDGNTVSNGITLTDKYGKMADTTLKFAPSSSVYSVELLIRHVSPLNLRLWIFPGNAYYTAVFSNFIAIIVFPLSVLLLIIFSVSASNKKHTPRTVALGLAASALSGGFIAFGRMAGMYQRTLFEVGIAFMELTLILFFYQTMTELKANPRMRDLWTGIGVLMCCAFVPVTSPSLKVILLKVFSLSFVAAVGVVVYYAIKNRKRLQGLQFGGFCLILYLICCILHWAFFWGADVLAASFYSAVIFPVSAGLALLLLSGREPAITREMTDAARLVYMPNDAEIGRFKDLLTLYMKEPEYRIHSENVSLYTYAICSKLGFTDEQASEIAQAAFLHDIGKLMLPKTMLLKQGGLTNEEYEQMKMHAKYGSDLFSSSTDHMLQIASIITLQHHERYDGNGYFGIAGKEINRYAQIVSIADVFDATTSKRSYKNSWGFDEGFNYIVEHSGTLFNKDYVDAFTLAKDEIKTIYSNAL